MEVLLLKRKLEKNVTPLFFQIYYRVLKQPYNYLHIWPAILV